MDFKILVAEDTYRDQKLYRLAFGEKAIVVADLQSAIRMASSRKYDLYVTDGTYPPKLCDREETGICFKFYGEIKKIDPKAKVILASEFDLGLPAVKEKYPDMTYMTKFDACAHFGEKLEKIITEIRAKGQA
jgi:hypothetical protein